MTRKTQGAIPSRRAAQPRSRLAPASTWKLEDAKAKFSELVRRARGQGPQTATVRGKPTVAVIDIEELARLMPKPGPEVGLVEFLEGLNLGGLEMGRERDNGREPTL